MMWAWKIGPALATGCTIVMKPSEFTSLTALVRIYINIHINIAHCGISRNYVNSSKKPGRVTCTRDSGMLTGRSFPPGVLNCVPALGAVGGAALASHLDVDKVRRLLCGTNKFLRLVDCIYWKYGDRTKNHGSFCQE